MIPCLALLTVFSVSTMLTLIPPSHPKPPNSDLPGIRAMEAIVKREPPTLPSPDRWSTVGRMPQSQGLQIFYFKGGKKKEEKRRKKKKSGEIR